MNFERHIFKELTDWKNRKDRKPLVLRGARQVGKTTIIKQLAESYKYKILLNLEKKEDRKYFEETDEVKRIMESLYLANNISTPDSNNTILFIDEIQESPQAIQLLRYFYEELPNLHVIAAGSLLELAMRKIRQFPVGRIEYLHMHPLSFSEYLLAIDYNTAMKQLDIIPVNDFAHNILLDQFNRYAIIGGMPEVINTYINHDKISVLPRIYESIWGTYKDDVEKYSSNETERRVIRHVISTAHLYLDKRIKFHNFGNSNYRSREVSEAMKKLDEAKIIQLIYPTTDVVPPIKPSLRKSPRLQFLDTGLVNYSLGIQGDLLSIKDLSKDYKGALIPHLITQEFKSLNSLNNDKPNFWVREKRQASSEVDLVITYQALIIPIEIKSGSTGSLKSLHHYMDRTNHPYAVRIYGGAFSIEKHMTPIGTPYLLMNMPYYLGTKIYDYLDYFFKTKLN